MIGSRAVLLVSLCLAIPALGQEPGRDAPPGHAPSDRPLILPPADRARVQAIAQEIICYCGCARQTVADCTCGVADDIRRSIWDDLGSGKSADAIVDGYVAAHGSEFRSMPKARGLGLLAWTVPYIALVLAAAIVLRIVYRWTRRPPAAPDTVTKDPTRGATEEADPYEARLRQELDELDSGGGGPENDR